MDLVDKEDGFILELRCLIDDLLQTSLEFSTVLRPSDHERHIDRDDTLISHRKWHFPARDTTCESLDDSSFSNSWISYETWIIFGFSI